MPREETIVGTIISADSDVDGWVVAEAHFVSGRVRRHFPIRNRFVVCTEQAQEVRIEADGDTRLLGGDTHESHDSWDDLSRTPLGQLASGFQPGPHVQVRVELRGFRVGDRVRVRGTHGDRRLETSRGYREVILESGALRPISIADPSVSESPPNTNDYARSNLKHYLGLLFATGLATAAALVARHPGPLHGLIAATWMSFSLTLGWQLLARWIGHRHLGGGPLRWRHIPEFRDVHLGNAREESFSRVFAASTATAFMVFFSLFLFTKSSIDEVSDWMFWWMRILSGVLALAATVVTLASDYRQTRNDRRIIKSLLSAPAARARQRSGWCRVEGVVMEGSEPLVRDATTEVFLVAPIEGVHADVSERFTGPSMLRVATGEGDLILHSEGMTVAGTNWRENWKNRHLVTCSLRISTADQVMVASHLTDEGASATGPESLIVYATRGDAVREVQAARLRAIAGPILATLPLATLALSMVTTS